MKKLLAILMALVMCCSLVVMAAAEEEYVYEGEAFQITSKYELDDSNWGIDGNGDDEDIALLYALCLPDSYDFGFTISVSENENGYKFVHNMYNAAVEDGEDVELFKIGDADAIMYFDTIYTYTDDYSIIIEFDSYTDEEQAIVDDLIAGFEITGTVTPPTVEEMKEVGIDVEDEATTAAAEEEKGGSTVVIIAIVAVAVVAVVAVVIVVSKKKK
jgi:hypothetical protein